MVAGGDGHGGSRRQRCKTGEEACGAGRVRGGAEVRGAPIYRRGEAVEGRDTGGGRPAAIYGTQGVAEWRDARFAASTRRLGQRHGEQEEGEHVEVAAAAWARRAGRRCC